MPRGGEWQESGGVGERPDSQRVTYLFLDGIGELYKDSIDEQRAEELFRQALALDSMHAPSLIKLSQVIAERGPEHYPQAVELAKRAYLIDSTDLWYVSTYARMLFYNDSLSEALPLVTKLCRKLPTNPDYHHLLAIIYYRLEMPYSAIQTLDSAEIKIGIYPELHLQKCALLAETNQMDRALAELKRYSANFPYDITALLFQASIYNYTERPELELECYRKVLAIDPANADALTGAYELSRQKGNTEEFLSMAIAAIRNPQIGFDTKSKIVEELSGDANLCKLFFPQISELTNALMAQYPDNYKAVEMNALFMMRSNAIKNGLDIVKGYFRNYPDNREALEMIAYFESLYGNQDTTLLYCQMHVDARPDEAEPLVLKAMWQTLCGESSKQIIKTYNKALKLTDDDVLRSSILGSIGDVCHSDNNNAKAYKYYEKALRYDDENALVLNNYAYFLALDSTNLERAENMAAKAILLEPRNSSYLDTYAWILFVRGNTEQAIKYIKQAISFDDTRNSELLVHYGDMLYATGDKFMAKIYWRRAEQYGHDPEVIAQKLKQP